MSSPFSTLSLLSWKREPEVFANSLGANLTELGFCGITDHSIDQDLIKDVLVKFKMFFELPLETKMKYFQLNLGGARGYTPIKVETPKGGYEADLKEFWHVGRELTDSHPFREWMPPNVWINEIPDFELKLTQLFAQFDSLGKNLLSAISVFLKLEKNFFNLKINNGNSVMRAIHYPKIIKEEKGERAGAHEDINLITLLIGGSNPGLEIQNQQGEWTNTTVDENTILVNVGDMLQRYTNHILVSTTHRVIATKDQKKSSRYSIPFFVHPNPDWFIETLPSCISKNNPNKYPIGILSEDFLRERLKDIKLL